MVGPSMVCGVHARRTVPDPLFQRAMSRHGIVHHRELEDAGVTKSVRARLIMDGTLQRLTRGLYSVQPPTARTWALAGAFIAGPKAAIGGWHALEAHGMATFSPLGIQPVSPTHITIWTPADEHRSPTASAPDVRWLFRRDKFNRLDRATEVRRLIDRHDAVLDVCEELQTSEVIALITRIHQERLADPARLAALLSERSRHTHRRLLADMSADAALGVHSALEHNYTIDVERRHELPTPQRQVVVGTCAADVWYEEYKLAIELDGWGYHRNRVRHDRRIDNLRAALGIETRRFGWHDVTDDPCGTARVIATILRARGWTGSLRSCRSCPSDLESFSGG
ncbi:uncharacterized protein DUF559 [Propioniferax innocua]|uniref:Uncharacterized protein DUF559 n=1 Tax=Propioniferax innocua TaxID=1753 RepID=A0A542ZA90_9ACTN|nr:uncharacterized protein DUF559 [Propioniferax innocua]